MSSLHRRCGPSIINAYEFASGVRGENLGWPWSSADGKTYNPARPLGGMVRFRAAWLVFTGRADAMIWPGQGDV